MPRTPFPTAEKGDFDVYIVGCNKLIVVKIKNVYQCPPPAVRVFPLSGIDDFILAFCMWNQFNVLIIEYL